MVPKLLGRSEGWEKHWTGEIVMPWDKSANAVEAT